jgi:hypothetical protein
MAEGTFHNPFQPGTGKEPATLIEMSISCR